MRVVVCWAHISGYMSACWRALARRPGVELHVIAFGAGAAPSSQNDGIGTGTNAPFRENVTDGFNCRLLDRTERFDSSLVTSLVRERKPDVLVIAGWFHSPYVKLAEDPSLRQVPRIMAMDTPLKAAFGSWQDSLRQRLARIKLHGYLKGMAAVVVPGERSWQYARLLGVPENKIHRGVYGIDYDAFAPLHGERVRQPGGWPRRFLYMGRYEATKGIDVLLEAHSRYRAAAKSDAWPLTCCGMGPMGKDIAAANRSSNGKVEDRGFVQPADQPPIMVQSSAFVLTSKYDPWPLVIVEACAAGFPIICTEACGSSVENVRPYYNGLITATNDPAATADAMDWMHRHYDSLPEWGARSQTFAAAYSANIWANRWGSLLKRAVGGAE